MDRRKPLTPPPAHGARAPAAARRDARDPAAPGVTTANSNTRISTGRPPRGTFVAPVAAPAQPRNSNTRIVDGRGQAAAPASPARQPGNRGLNSDRMRAGLVARLRTQGIADETVLAAMLAVPRHAFVDEALASRAYEDAALPIGHGQTISQPWIVARMIAMMRNGRALGRVLEVGTGCGYQAAVLAGVAREVYSIERIRPLHELARERLRPLRLHHVRLVFGDGMQGVPEAAPFDGIVVAAAGLAIPERLLEQLAVGGRLLAPVGGNQQHLIMVERTGPQQWVRSEMESVRFVPLKQGVLT